MTEETQQSTETSGTVQTTDQNVATTVSETGKTKEGKKEKCRPMTKVVIRRLPPSMTQEQFMEQVSPLPDYDYMYFAKADMSLGQYAYSRVYIDFVDQQDIFGFREKFDNYVFVDGKGMEYPAVVEYAPFQRVPKKRIGKKKDLKCGTIESDPYYISFLESLKNQETDPTIAQPKTEYSFQPSDHTPKRVTTTPLLDFLKQRKQEKQRLRDEKREEKRRRDLERKRSKDEPVISKVLKNPDERERDKDKEASKENKENKEDKEKDKVLQKDMKNRNKKEDKYQNKMGRDRDAKVVVKNFRDRDERVKEKEVKQNKKHEDKKLHNKKEDREIHVKEERAQDKEEVNHKERRLEKRGKSYEKMRQEKKRLAESQKKQAFETAAEEPVKIGFGKTCDEDCDNIEDRDDDEDDTSPVNKQDNASRSEQTNKKSIDSVKLEGGTAAAEHSSEDSKQEEISRQKEWVDNLDGKLVELCERLGLSISSNEEEEEEGEIEEEISSREREKKSEKKSPTKSRVAKRRSSLESGGESGSGSKSSGSAGASAGGGAEASEHDGACLRRHKSLDGGNDSNLQKSEADDKDKDKKDPRLERRIRNKDRPAMEIYRPGMGKFSKQRMEREKGSDERATPSQSPTPTSTNNQINNPANAPANTTANNAINNPAKPGKPSGSEVRSMTFKRSVSRDV